LIADDLCYTAATADNKLYRSNCVTMCYMRSATLRDLHLKTSEIVRRVVEGESVIIEKRGVPVAEIRPFQGRPAPRMPDREALIMSGRKTMDSGRILEQDRT